MISYEKRQVLKPMEDNMEAAKDNMKTDVNKRLLFTKQK